MEKDEIKDRLFDVLNDTDNLTIQDILVEEFIVKNLVEIKWCYLIQQNINEAIGEDELLQILSEFSCPMNAVFEP